MGSFKVVFVARHVQLAKTEGVGYDDRPISSAGIEQARALRGFASLNGVSIVVTSTLRRAVRTGRMIADGSSLSLVASPLLNEIDPSEADASVQSRLYKVLSSRWRANALLVSHGGFLSRLIRLVGMPFVESPADMIDRHGSLLDYGQIVPLSLPAAIGALGWKERDALPHGHVSQGHVF